MTFASPAAATASGSNRSSLSGEEAEPYTGPFIGRARALVDCQPSPYDRDALKFKVRGRGGEEGEEWEWEGRGKMEGRRLRRGKGEERGERKGRGRREELGKRKREKG